VLLDLDGNVAAALGDWADRVDTVSASIADRPAAAILIRPDGYVAWAANTFDAEAAAGLQAALHRWFGEPRAK